MQTTLNFAPAEIAEINATKPPTNRQVWEKFDESNPDVFEAIRQRALRLHSEGFKRWSIEEIWNWLRWHRQCRTTGKPYALNNNFKAFYVAKLVDENPQLDEMFVQRKG